MIRDGHAVRVAREVLQHMRGTAEGWLGVDDPVVPKESSQEARGTPRLRSDAEAGPRMTAGRAEKARLRPATNFPRKTRLSTLTGKKNG